MQKLQSQGVELSGSSYNRVFSVIKSLLTEEEEAEQKFIKKFKDVGFELYKTEEIEKLYRGLKFETLRQANIARLPEFKNGKGETAHSKPDGSDWTPAQWLQAVCGELGEYANLRKKYERGDIDETEFLTNAAHEIADVLTYLDILAMQLGIDLDNAVITKFNLVSHKVGSTVSLAMDGSRVFIAGMDWAKQEKEDSDNQ